MPIETLLALIGLITVFVAVMVAVITVIFCMEYAGFLAVLPLGHALAMPGRHAAELAGLRVLRGDGRYLDVAATTTSMLTERALGIVRYRQTSRGASVRFVPLALMVGTFGAYLLGAVAVDLNVGLRVTLGMAALVATGLVDLVQALTIRRQVERWLESERNGDVDMDRTMDMDGSDPR